MATRNLTLSQFHQKVLALVPELREATVRGLQASALRLVAFTVEEIDAAKPFPATDRGELRASVEHEFVEDGATVAVSAPHAPMIEYGTRPHWPPFEPILEWVRRKGLGGDKPEAVAGAIRKKIATEGIAPRFFFKKAWERVLPVVGHEINRELAALAAKS
jgi:hypothetical protein